MAHDGAVRTERTETETSANQCLSNDFHSVFAEISMDTESTRSRILRSFSLRMDLRFACATIAVAALSDLLMAKEVAQSVYMSVDLGPYQGFDSM